MKTTANAEQNSRRPRVASSRGRHSVVHTHRPGISHAHGRPRTKEKAACQRPTSSLTAVEAVTRRPLCEVPRL